MANGQLPYHSLQPLLGHFEIHKLCFGAIKISRQCFRELLLELNQPGRYSTMQISVPQSKEGLVKGLIQLYEVDKASHLYRFSWVLVRAGKLNAVMQGQWPVPFKCVGSVYLSAIRRIPRTARTYRSVMKRTQKSRLFRELSMKLSFL